MYQLVRPLLFRLDAEKAHNLALAALAKAPQLMPRHSGGQPVTLMGLTFPNRLGLPPDSTKTAKPSPPSTAQVSALSKSAPSPRAPRPATTNRASSGSPNTRPSSTAWASTTSA